jgi:tetratricopeptide (TPR) repeat protein
MHLARQIHRLDPADTEDFYFANLAVELAENHSDTLLFAESLDNLGLLYRYHSQFAKSIPLHIRAVSLVRDMDVDPYFKMRFANNAGVSARYDQAYDLAVEYYLFALKIAEENNDLRNIAIASNGLGNSLSYIEGKSEEALEFYMKALQTEEERGNTLGMAMNYLSIASYYSRKKEYITAREYLDELLIINTERKDQHGIGMTYEYYGHSYFEEGGNLQLAEDYYQKALGVFEELGQEHKVASMLIALGEVNSQTGKTAKSLEYLRQAHQMAKALNNKALIMESARLISETFETNGNFAQALAYFKTAQAYKDSLSLTEQEATIAGLRMEYDFEKKEAELSLLQSDKELQEQQFLVAEEKFKREKTMFFGLILAILAITLVIILSLRNLNLKKNLAIQQEEQKRQELESAYQNNLLQAEILATRMQMNPHFLFNCLNSVKLLIQKDQKKGAIKYLTTLSRFIRDILQTGKMTTVTLEEELELTKKYIQLEENRFQEKFDFEFCLKDIPLDDLKNTKVPPMILQPFVENSIWHGLLPSNADLKKLRIAITKDKDGVTISIRDNGVGRQMKPIQTSSKHKSMGVTITQQRMELFNKITNIHMNMTTLDHRDEHHKPNGTEVQIHLEEA